MKTIASLSTITLILVFYAVLLAWPVQLLWNDVAVRLFHMPVLDFWDALKLSLLCSILFKGGSSSSKKE
ncbi:hypothetical protein DYU11_11670 [Fibrisoma montanum]|uniref:Uncharacterized protein n=1 Tax=Fibrisoma montanum TaxID=2305895 RepID=A0A418MB78_9BACT|nr:hypothetical protein [Fibrisoma montanum]RIV23633.1 hypothetical protein DYU11_11670 [Fibrisoma montanum]